MSDSILKKEFNKADVERIRNLVTKKYNNSTKVQSGYTKQQEDHKEGDIWEENNRTWTIKNGIKQNITKLDPFKKLAFIPLLCPKCSNPMKTEYDKKMYHIHNMCMDCVAKFETRLKIQGKYKEYAEGLIKGNIKYYLQEYEQFLDSISANTHSEFVSEDGIVSKWQNNNVKQYIEKHKEELNNVKKSLDNE